MFLILEASSSSSFFLGFRLGVGKAFSISSSITADSQNTFPFIEIAGVSAVGTSSLYQSGLSNRSIRHCSNSISFSNKAIHTRSQNGHQAFVSRYRITFLVLAGLDASVSSATTPETVVGATGYFLTVKSRKNSLLLAFSLRSSQLMGPLAEAEDFGLIILLTRRSNSQHAEDLPSIPKPLDTSLDVASFGNNRALTLARTGAA
mmetsp:Transcript_3925/g.5630  ORF Transcript_3925/g.5630 Transcript_3925/m.5630 type:complete len:204 (+) Transcript_3925:873-1484(+)